VADAGLIRAAALLLLVVFAVKAAVFPLYLWLPGAYSAAHAPVAALFAIMTKVGVYAIVRVYTLIFGADAGLAADAAAPWLLPFALATLALGMLGALAAAGLRRLIAYLVVASAGTQLAAAGLFSENGIAASLYYLAHSTFALAALFLLADLIARQRGEHADRFVSAPAVAQPVLLGLLFLTGAAVAAGLPPFSGFLGKLMVLTAARGTVPGYWVWGVVLAAGLLGLVVLSRAGSMLFWRTVSDQPPPHAAPATLYAVAPAVVLLAGNLLLAAFADPVRAFADAVAEELVARTGYIESVLGPGPRSVAAAPLNGQ
jgi:multicomponent K+:H+ antiporter subunit D